MKSMVCGTCFFLRFSRCKRGYFFWEGVGDGRGQERVQDEPTGLCSYDGQSV